MALKFKERKSTDKIVVVKKNIANEPVKELRAEAKRMGDFDIGYHFVLYRDGYVGEGREATAPAGHRFPECDTSLYVLVDTGNVLTNNISDLQKKELQKIQKMYPNAQMVELRTDFGKVEGM